MSHLTFIADNASILVSYKKTTILAHEYQKCSFSPLQIPACSNTSEHRKRSKSLHSSNPSFAPVGASLNHPSRRYKIQIAKNKTLNEEGVPKIKSCTKAISV
jgi:hypothetical protein